MRFWVGLTVVLGVVPGVASAQRVMPFEAMRRAMEGHLRPMEEFEQDRRVMDCSGIPVSVLETQRGSVAAQYIYNHMYEWTTIDIQGERCVFLNIPFRRGLTREEVRMLMSAALRQWPVPPPDTRPLRPEDDLNGGKPIDQRHLRPDRMRIESPQDCQRDAQGACIPGDDGREKTKVPPDKRVFIDDGYHLGPPWNALTLVVQSDPDGTARYATAIQISPYVYATAAHVIYDLATHTRHTGLLVRPAWNLPQKSAAITVDAVIDEAYKAYDNVSDQRSYAHDLGFLRASQPRTLATYPQMQRVFEGQNCFDLSYSNLGQPFCDPYYVSNPAAPGLSTFFYYQDTPPYDYATITTAGYPYTVAAFDNAAAGFRPVKDVVGAITGWPPGYEMYTPNVPGATPVIGMHAYISEGESGGPIFAEQYHYSGLTTTWKSISLIGIGTAYFPHDPVDGTDNYRYSIGTGNLDFNHAFYDYNRLWEPGYPINFLVPPDGVIYDNQNVPDFSATAGAYTPQLRWHSDIDGDLGQGGSVSANAILSPGEHTLTVSLGTPPSSSDSGIPASNPPYGEATHHITITAAPPFLNVTPNPVPIGYAKTVKATVTWLSTAYPYVELREGIDGAPPVSVQSGVTQGSYAASIQQGKAYQFVLTRAGRDIVLGSTSVATVTVPWLHADPNPAVLPPGADTTTTHLAWDSQGHGSSLDVRVAVDQQPSTLLAWTGATGQDDPSWLQAGHVYRFSLHPHNQPGTTLALLDVVVYHADTVFADGFDALHEATTVPGMPIGGMA